LRYAISDDIVCRRSISWRFSTSTVVTWCFCSSTWAWRIYPIPWWPHEMTSLSALSKSTNTIITKSKLLTLCLKCTDLWIIFGQILHAQPQSQTFSGERETQHSTEHNALHNMTSLYSPCLPSWIEIKAINKALEEITCYASIITSGVGPPYRGRAHHRVGGPAPPWKCCSLSLNPCLLHWVRQGITLWTLGSALGSQGVMPCCQGITLHFQLIKASAGSS
jgi:hypothetical protein